MLNTFSLFSLGTNLTANDNIQYISEFSNKLDPWISKYSMQKAFLGRYSKQLRHIDSFIFDKDKEKNWFLNF